MLLFIKFPSVKSAEVWKESKLLEKKQRLNVQYFSHFSMTEEGAVRIGGGRGGGGEGG